MFCWIEGLSRSIWWRLEYPHARMGPSSGDPAFFLALPSICSAGQEADEGFTVRSWLAQIPGAFFSPLGPLAIPKAPKTTACQVVTAGFKQLLLQSYRKFPRHGDWCCVSIFKVSLSKRLCEGLDVKVFYCKTYWCCSVPRDKICHLISGC